MKKWRIDGYADFFNKIICVCEAELVEALRNDSKKEYYKESFEKKKKNGSRKIYCVKKSHVLYTIQKNLRVNFLDNVLLSDSAYGFQKGKSYFDFLEHHTSVYPGIKYLRLDIADFFGSIRYDELEKILSFYFEESENLSSKEKENLINYTMEIITYEKKLLQGSVTSPVVSNIYFRQLDQRIGKYCRLLDVDYSRYADDLLFSNYQNKLEWKFIKRIDYIIGSLGLSLNMSKTKQSDAQIVLKGFVLGEEIHLSRKKLSSLNRIVFYLSNRKWKNTSQEYEELNKHLQVQDSNEQLIFSGKYSLANYLNGNRAFFIANIPYIKSTKKKEKYEKLITRIDNVVDKLIK
jgi:hypothetical protein